MTFLSTHSWGEDRGACVWLPKLLSKVIGSTKDKGWNCWDSGSSSLARPESKETKKIVNGLTSLLRLIIKLFSNIVTHSILHLCWCWKSWGWLDWQRGCCSPWVAETGLSAQDPAPDPGLVWRGHRTQTRTDLRGLIHQGMLQKEVVEEKAEL